MYLKGMHAHLQAFYGLYWEIMIERKQLITVFIYIKTHHMLLFLKNLIGVQGNVPICLYFPMAWRERQL